ncbi:MAG: hypothetical protein HQM10_23050 [Candidatus Riflebacteria bacterium]|nr:hypothetical protein [Candidatus Riflebacteria bacterium]
MDQSPRICPKCSQANFPIAEFCRHCGEPMFEMGTVSRKTVLQKTIGALVDGFFWFIDEIVRWWEIGKITIELKRIRKKRSNIMKNFSDSATEIKESSPEKEILLKMSEDVSRLSNREEFLRTRSWHATPELLLAGIIVFFFMGIFFLKPVSEGIIVNIPSPAAISGDIRHSVEIPISGVHNVVTSCGWLDDRLLIGGDAGVHELRIRTKQMTQLSPLPPDYFCRQIFQEESGKLLLVGYGGLFSADASALKPLYEKEDLPVKEFNCAAKVKGGHLIGTLASGIISAKAGRFAKNELPIKSTVLGFAFFDNDCWMLTEKGILRGNGTSFSPVSLPSLEGKRMICIAASDKSLLIGTDNGLVAGYKEDKSWIWTVISAEKSTPKNIYDILISNGTILVLSDDSLFRLEGTILRKIADSRGGRTMAIGQQCLAVTSPEKVVLHYFTESISSDGQTVFKPIVPLIGSFTPQTSALPAIQPVIQPVIQPTVQPIVQSSVQPSVQPLQTIIQPSFQTDINKNTQSPGSVVPESLQTPTTTPSVNQSAPSIQSSSSLPQALSGSYISFLSSLNGNLWAGTVNSGLWCLTSNSWINFSRSNNSLSDDQIVSIFPINNRIFFYSWAIGICTIENNSVKTILSAKNSEGFVAMSGESESIYFLFRDGSIKRLKQPDEVETIDKISQDFSKTARNLFSLNNKLFVVTDQGIILKNIRGSWSLEAFEKPQPKQKAMFSLTDKNGVILTALNDGRIFSFQSNKVSFAGKLNSAPNHACFSSIAMFSDGTNIYSFSNGQIKNLQVKSPIPFTSFAYLPELKKIYFATSQGLKEAAF